MCIYLLLESVVYEANISDRFVVNSVFVSITFPSVVKDSLAPASAG